MKTKKLLLPVIVLIIAILLMGAYSVVTNIAQKPTITQQEFSFSITYEWNGQTETIESVYVVSFAENDGYIDATKRIYKGTIVGMQNEEDTAYVISESADGSVLLETNFHPDYMMGDPAYDYYTYEPFAPKLFCYDADYAEYTDEQTLAEYGAKLISWEYPEPIENTFIYSHIAHLSNKAVLPLLAIALLALLVIVIFAKREKTLIKKPVNAISITFNFIILFSVVPFLTIYGILSDINGSSPAFIHQLGYLLPATTTLGVAASIGLRRKGHGKSGLIVQFIAPVILAALMACLFI